MPTPYRAMLIALALGGASVAGPSSAQFSGGGGLLGVLLPDLATTDAGNAAGVLSYCVKNKLVNATSASSVLGKLTGRKGVKDSPAFSLGQQGTLQTQGSELPLASLKGKVKNRLCDLVLSHATSLL